MTYESRVGPYMIISQDAFLSSDDLAISPGGKDVSLTDVANYVDAMERKCNSEMGRKFREVASNRSSILISDVDDYMNSLISLKCSGEPKKLPTTDLAFKSCDLVIGDLHIPTTTGEGNRDEDKPESLVDDFMAAFGAKPLDTDAAWSNATSNCHAYTLHRYLGLPAGIVVDSLSNIKFVVRDVPDDPDSAEIFMESATNAFETVLSNFYRPVGMIASSTIELRPEAARAIMGRWNEETHEYVAEIVGLLNTQFEMELDAMLQSGSLDPDKARDGDYVLVMSTRISHDLSEPGCSDPEIMNHHSGILRYRYGRWFLESKLSFGLPVYETPIGMHAIVQTASNAEVGYDGQLFYRIYEPDVGEAGNPFDMDAAIRAEPITKHPILLRKLRVPREEAEKSVATLNEFLN